MKKIHLFLLGLTICLFTGCYDKLWDAIDGLDSRVTKLEELCKEMNTNITSLQTIVDVLQSNDFITSILEMKKEGKVVGYTIAFGKHEPITIYHGQDGKDGADGENGQDGKDGQDGQNGADGQNGYTPVIGVAQGIDGVYYWTLNGEWLLDNNGNKLPVSGKDGQNGTNGSNGQDGKDGISPQLKIEEGYWYVSYDNGISWMQVGKATGEDGENGEKGDRGDSMFESVTHDEHYAYFTFADGTIIKIAKHTERKKVDLVMFMGQSNMVGRGTASQATLVGDGHGYEFKAISDPTKLYPVVEPFGLNEDNQDSEVTDSGRTGSLVSAFMEEYYRYRLVPIVGVSCSKGGTATSFWAPGGKPLNDAIARHDSAKVWLEENGYTIEHDYMVWLQGESDAGKNISAYQYANNLTAIIEEMIDKTSIEFCAVIRIGHYKPSPTRNKEIIYAQTNLCKTYDKAILVSTKLAGYGSSDMPDNSHFKQYVYNEVGKDAGLNTAYYINNGKKPSMYDPEYNNYFPYGDINTNDAEHERIYIIGETLQFINMEEVASTKIVNQFYTTTSESPQKLTVANREGYRSWKNIPLYAGQQYQLNPKSSLVVFYDKNENVISTVNIRNTYGTDGIMPVIEQNCYMSIAIGDTFIPDDADCTITRIK